MKYLCILLCLTSMGCFNGSPGIKTGLEGKPLPAFTLLLMDSATSVQSNNIPSGSPLILFLFNPNCPYCRAETHDMIKNMNSLKGIQFYMISEFPMSMIRQYYDHYHLNRYPNVTMARDNQAYLINYFKTPGVPYIAIYNKDKKLKQVVIGRVGMNVIKDIADRPK